MRRTCESSFSALAMASDQLAAAVAARPRRVATGILSAVAASGVDDGQRNPEPERSLLTEGLFWSLESVAYAPPGESSMKEGEDGVGSRKRVLGEAGDGEEGESGGDIDECGWPSKIPASGLRRGELVGEWVWFATASVRLCNGWTDWVSTDWTWFESTFSMLPASRGAEMAKGMAPLDRLDLDGDARDGEADLRSVVVF